MTEEEIKKFINKCLDKKLHDFKSGYMRRMQEYEIHIQRHINQECSNIINTSKTINNRMSAIEQAMQGNQKGLQNVYDVFNKLTDGDFIGNFQSHKLDTLNKVEYMRKHLWDIEKWLKKCEKKMSVINDLYSLRNNNEEMISKLAKICKAMNDEGDE